MDPGGNSKRRGSSASKRSRIDGNDGQVDA